MESYRTLIKEYIINELLGNVNKKAQYETAIYKVLNQNCVDYERVYKELVAAKHEKLIEQAICTGDKVEPLSIIYEILYPFLKTDKQNQYVGSYIIQNKATGAVYIGESINIFNRLVTHVSDLYTRTHHCQKLQEAFDETRNISSFNMTPVFMYDMGNQDKENAKHEALYIEAATYLLYLNNHIEVYNTVNPYKALKNKETKCIGFDIDCVKVLRFLYFDKYNILDIDLRREVQKDLKDAFPDVVWSNRKYRELYKNQVSHKNDTKKKLISEKNEWEQKYKELKKEYDKVLKNKFNKVDPKTSKQDLFSKKEIFDELVKQDLLPENYSYGLINKALIESKLGYYKPGLNVLFASDQAIQNNWFVVTNKNLEAINTAPRYKITKEGRQQIIDAIIKHPKEHYIVEQQK